MIKKIIFGIIALILILLLFNLYVQKQILRTGEEGLYKIGTCFRDDEFGVTYKVTGTAKGRTWAQVIVSEKYPSNENYKIGYVEGLHSNENPRKLYPLPCP